MMKIRWVFLIAVLVIAAIFSDLIDDGKLGGYEPFDSGVSCLSDSVHKSLEAVFVDTEALWSAVPDTFYLDRDQPYRHIAFNVLLPITVPDCHVGAGGLPG